MCKVRGINTEFIHTFGTALESAGLEEIEQSHRPIPVGWGPEEIAMDSARNIQQALSNGAESMAMDIGITVEEFHSMIKCTAKEFYEYQVHWNMFYAYG